MANNLLDSDLPITFTTSTSPTLMRAFPADVLEKLLGPPETFSQDGILAVQGSPCPDILMIVFGMVKLYMKLPNGQKHMVGTLFPGDSIGFGNEGFHTLTSIAAVDVVIRRGSREEIRRVAASDPDIADKAFTAMGHFYRRAQERMSMVARMDAVGKVAHFLFEVATGQNVIHQPRPVITIHISRSEIADYLGMVEATVSRTFTILKKEGLIEYLDAGHVSMHLPDIARIYRLAKGVDGLSQNAGAIK